MEFKRIDSKTVQCTITEDDLDEYGFSVEDFFTDQEKSREFLEQIVERAEEEVGYKAESGMVSMQLMRMPDNSLTITFSEKPEDGIQGMIRHIQDLAGMIDDKKSGQKVIDVNDNEKVKKEEKASSGSLQKEIYNKLNKKKVENQKEELNAPKIFAFDTFEDLEQMAECSPFSMDKINSTLYKDTVRGTYYLLVKKGRLDQKKFLSICQQITEFGSFCTQDPFVEDYCDEHFRCIIKKNALKIVSTL